MDQTRLRAMNEQINTIEEAFNRFRSLCVEFTQTEENSKRSVADLEYENKVLVQQNQALQRQVDNYKRQSERAKDAQEAVFWKLGNAYRVICDLINQVERLQVADHLQPAIQNKAEESEEMRQVIGEAVAQTLSCSPRSPDSNRTPRQHCPPLRRGMLKWKTPNGHRDGTAEGPSEVNSHSPSHLPSIEASGNKSTSESESSASVVNIDVEERWSIHYGNNPPGVCNMSFGPVSYTRLLQYSVIAKEHVDKLKQLENAGDLCLRLHSTSNLLFLKDPIFLEERAEGIKKTYILDWGTPQENALLTDFIRSREEVVLHTFVFPEKKKWFYVGGFTWHVADHLHSIWPSLGKTPQERNKVLSKLCERSSDYLEADVAIKLDNGTLSQICLEISSDGLWDISRQFAGRMDYPDNKAV